MCYNGHSMYTEKRGILRNILLISTGGTIASVKTSQGLAPQIGPDDLLGYVPAHREFCRVDTLPLLNLDSTNMQPHHWLQIVGAIREHYQRYDGFVVCHGTDTMAYTAAALSYLIQKSPKPIVVTGAQKPIDLDVTDARTNLLDSLRYASSSRSHGVVIVFDGKVILGTRARKERTKSYNAFSSINYPYLATIQDGRITRFFTVPVPDGGPVFYDQLSCRVGLFKLIPGMGPQLLLAMADSCDAIIIESFGVGGLPADPSCDFTAALTQLTGRGKTVVMTTQVPYEGSDMAVYQVGHLAKRQLGLLESYDMTLEATVTKLMWILGQTCDPARIQALYHAPVGLDTLYAET